MTFTRQNPPFSILTNTARSTRFVREKSEISLRWIISVKLNFWDICYVQTEALKSFRIFLWSNLRMRFVVHCRCTVDALRKMQSQTRITIYLDAFSWSCKHSYGLQFTYKYLIKFKAECLIACASNILKSDLQYLEPEIFSFTIINGIYLTSETGCFPNNVLCTIFASISKWRVLPSIVLMASGEKERTVSLERKWSFVQDSLDCLFYECACLCLVTVVCLNSIPFALGLVRILP